MTIQEQLTVDMKDAMKAQDAERLSTVRMLKTALKNKQIDAMRELTEDEVMAVIKTQIKQLKDASETFRAAGRTETVEANEREIATLEKYLPAQMDEAALSQIVKDAVTASGATSKADQGKAMGAAMKAVAGRADGNRVKAIVESMLTAFTLAAMLALTAHPALAAAQDAAFAASGVRIMRVFLMLMGIVSVNFIIMGAVSVMTASGRDHGHHHGLQQMAMGIFGTILMAGLIVIATAALQRLG
ncbi:GatB/YqeY domain-containing protein [bacterium]|nr:GatB/YqeY domain-containing protein [bacterium]